MHALIKKTMHWIYWIAIQKNLLYLAGRKK